MRRAFRCLAVATTLLATGCGASSNQSPAEARVERCTERFLERAKSDTAEVRRYVETTYCARFEQRGWIHDDGTLSLDAYTKIGTEECARVDANGEAQAVPCEEGEAQVLDCALLHLVRRAKVRAYVARLSAKAHCDDGTPLDDLGTR